MTLTKRVRALKPGWFCVTCKEMKVQITSESRCPECDDRIIHITEAFLDYLINNPKEEVDG